MSSFIDWCCYYTQVSYTGSWEPLVFGVPPHKYKYLKWPPLWWGDILFLSCPSQFVSTTPLKLFPEIYYWSSLSAQLLWNYWTEFHETWLVVRTPYVVVHITRKFVFPKFCGLCPFVFEFKNFSKYTSKAACQHNSSETTEQNFIFTLDIWMLNKLV